MRTMTIHFGEETAMPRVLKVEVGTNGSDGPRFVGQQDRDERLFQRAYVEDHSREFRKALRTVRVAFLVRMALLS